MIKIDFEFISTHRNRSLWPNPCLFEVPWSGSGQHTGLNALDPISSQTPIVQWTGQNIAINATVVSVNSNSVIVSAPINSFSQVVNYYQGAELNQPPSYRIDSSRFLSQSGGLDYMQLSVPNLYIGLQAGDPVTIQTTSIPNTLYVPAGSDVPNAYVGQYLYNETLGQSTLITGYDSEFHKVIATIPVGWTLTDKYSIRQELPSVGNFAIGAGSTTSIVNISGISSVPNLGDFLRFLPTNEIVQITNFDTTTGIATVSPALSTAFPAGTIVELLLQTSDNYRTLSYAGTIVGQHEQVAYDINLVSASLPNILLKNGYGGYPSDYPFFYIELYDTNHPSQNNLFSNNHANKSYFKVTTPTGQLLKRTEKFTKFTGDLSHKTIRFRPTSNFRVVWRLPTGEEVKFVEQDTTSPQLPNQALQTAVMFSLKRN